MLIWPNSILLNKIRWKSVPRRCANLSTFHFHLQNTTFIYFCERSAWHHLSLLFGSHLKIDKKMQFLTLLSVCIMSFASPSLQDAAPGLQNFLRTVFRHISSATGDLTVTVCKTRMKAKSMRMSIVRTSFLGSNQSSFNHLRHLDHICPEIHQSTFYFFPLRLER